MSPMTKLRMALVLLMSPVAACCPVFPCQVIWLHQSLSQLQRRLLSQLQLQRRLHSSTSAESPSSLRSSARCSNHQGFRALLPSSEGLRLSVVSLLRASALLPVVVVPLLLVRCSRLCHPAAACRPSCLSLRSRLPVVALLPVRLRAALPSWSPRIALSPQLRLVRASAHLQSRPQLLVHFQRSLLLVLVSLAAACRKAPPSLGQRIPVVASMSCSLRGHLLSWSPRSSRSPQMRL